MVSLRTSFWAGYFFQDLEIILTYVKCSVLRCSEGVYRFFLKSSLMDSRNYFWPWRESQNLPFYKLGVDGTPLANDP